MRIVKQNLFKNLGELHKEWTEAGGLALRSRESGNFSRHYNTALLTSQVTYVNLVPRGNETLRRNARGTPSALSSSESYV